MDRMKKINDVFEIKKYTDDLQAIIFDLDDTLYPLKDYVQSGFHQISRLFLGHASDVYDELWNAYIQLSVGKKDEAVAEAIRMMLQAQDMDSQEMQEKCLRIYDQHRPDIQPYDGVAELLAKLREKGIHCCLLVDGDPEVQREKLRALGIVSYFDEIIFSDEIAGHGDVKKFRRPNQICFEIMQLRLDIPFDKIGYIGFEEEVVEL